MQKLNQNTATCALGRLCAGIVVSATIAGCSSGASTPTSIGGLLPGSPQVAISNARVGKPDNCGAPAVWISNSTANSVVGYDTTGAVCMTLTSANGIAFSQPQGLASDHVGNLYVADIFNNRVVVFKPNGQYWSTLNVPNLAPIAVCVSNVGVVGVVSNAGSSPIDFYPSKGLQNSISNPSSQTVPLTTVDRYCGFDHRGDFFSSGYNGSYVLHYVRYSNVNVAGAAVQVCTDPVCTGNHKWFGMYSRLAGGVNTLSVEDLTTANVLNFQVNLGAANLLTFVTLSSQPTTALAGYPTGCTWMGAIAPSRGSGNNSRLYVAPCASGSVQYAVNAITGGLLTPFATIASPAGISTHPNGQF